MWLEMAKSIKENLLINEGFSDDILLVLRGERQNWDKLGKNLSSFQ